MFSRFSEENFGGNLRLVEGLAEVAEENGARLVSWLWNRKSRRLGAVVRYDDCIVDV